MWKEIAAFIGAGAALYAAQQSELISEKAAKILAVIGSTEFVLYLANRLYFSGGRCYETERLDGKFVIITGANTGIGKETAAELARRGATVIMACRNTEKAEAAKAEIIGNYGIGRPTALTKNVLNSKIKQVITPVNPHQLIVEHLDLSSFKSIREFAQRIREGKKKVDILINNAGIMYCPYMKTADGFEMQVGTNHLGHFLLTELLLPEMNKGAKGTRIILVSSLANVFAKDSLLPFNVDEAHYNSAQCYCRSKLANAMYANYLSKRLLPDGIQTASVHPGSVMTELARHSRLLTLSLQLIFRPLMKSSWEGSQTTIYTALTPNLHSGDYYADCAVAKANPLVYDAKAQEEMISASRKAVGLD
ncbi:unnamed protein product [Rodentolepis nana]|uniref:Retinol dehydrogenase 12 n=1 Tax=Rodentolepis nana TaxID=102285 RepID=A0A0R3TZ50_RODNA|nr:unnamed protein product [Rodentolepis nana]